jgi:hypothetical protein
MNDRALFKACTTQCSWCFEQWPLVLREGVLVHVAPFTKDPRLCFFRCDALPIRSGLKYTGYKGGKQKKWKVPKPEAIKQIVAEYYAKCKGGLGRVVDSPDNRSFWRTGVEATLEVATWPKWKRGGENAEDTPPERLKECRQELSLYDAMDYWTRIACTENLQYRPRIEKGCYTQPTCNYGFGCTTCWERYEVKMEEESRNHCD